MLLGIIYLALAYFGGCTVSDRKIPATIISIEFSDRLQPMIMAAIVEASVADGANAAVHLGLRRPSDGHFASDINIENQGKYTAYRTNLVNVETFDLFIYSDGSAESWQRFRDECLRSLKEKGITATIRKERPALENK